jgi:glycosyltransferase involved in cell wall biosynthesis
VRALKIVQIGYDVTPFEGNVYGDTQQRHNHYGRMLAEKRPGSELILVSLNAPSITLPGEHVTFIGVPGNSLTRCFGLLRVLKYLHRIRRIDVITTQTLYEDCWTAVAFGALYGVPVVGQEHTDPRVASQHQAGLRKSAAWLRKQAARAFTRRLHAIRAVSPGSAANIDHKNVFVIPVPITLSIQNSAYSHASSRVLFVGRLAPEKNIFTWLNIASQILLRCPKVNFDIVGDGPLRNQLENHAIALGISPNVVFHGWIPYDRLQNFYSSSTLLLVTSLYEGFGRMILEAIASGLPVVSSRTAGSIYILEKSDAGVLIDVSDIHSTATAVCKIICSQETQTRMREAGQQLAKRWSLEVLSQAWIDLLCRVADNASGYNPDEGSKD